MFELLGMMWKGEFALRNWEKSRERQ